MTPAEYMTQLQEILNLMYSTLETIQATAETMLDTVATERAALDTLAAPAFSAPSYHHSVTNNVEKRNAQSIGAQGIAGKKAM